MTVIAAYGGIFAVIISIIAVGYQPPQPTSLNSAVASAATQAPSASPSSSDAPSVDQVVATDVAAGLAEQTNMPVAPDIASLSISLAAKTDLAQTSDSSIVKPQIVQATASRRDITTYVTQAGDTVQSVANQFGLTPDTVRWANNLVADTLSPGHTLQIAPVDGVIYTVKAGDTADSVAKTYNTSKDRIISFNDLELSGLQPGTRVIVPGGVLPDNQRPGYQAKAGPTTMVNYGNGVDPGFRVNSGISGVSAGNKYAWGNCTWYAYERRTQLGLPVGSYWGNAKTWAYYAAQDGFQVNRTPGSGAILVDNSGYYGHVAIVESVASNGDITISEMNNYAYGGFGQVDRRTISAGQAASYQYIH